MAVGITGLPVSISWTRFRTWAAGDAELKDLLNRLVAEEREAATRDLEGSSYERRVLHGKVDIIRAELVKRRRRRESG